MTQREKLALGALDLAVDALREAAMYLDQLDAGEIQALGEAEGFATFCRNSLAKRLGEPDAK
jgi:hypothetical protein